MENTTHVFKTCILALCIFVSYNSFSQTTIDSEDFESGWGIWNDGGGDCTRTDGTGTPNGTWSIDIQDNSGVASSMTTDDIDITAYTSIDFTFDFEAISMESGEDFWVQYSDDGGASYTTIATFARGVDFNNNTSYTPTISIDTGSYTFSTNSRFRIRCDASGNGDDVYIDNILIEGYSVSGPEINIQGNATNIASGDITPQIADDTDFGNVNVTGGTNPNTFTIQNLGTTDVTLTGTGPTYVAISGTHAADFNITANPTTPITASSSTTFTVTFNPSALGLRTATLTIANNDTNENPYTFDIQGTGTTPSYCTSNGNAGDNFDTGTRLVTFNTINNATPVEDNDYSDFTGISTTVTQSSSYNLTVNVNTDGNYIVQTFAWIDWNQDFDFDDAGESFDLGSANNVVNGATSASPLSITIPGTSTLGTTRMRISTKYSTDPTNCETGFDGEVEDYSIVIISASPVPEINLQGLATTILDGDPTPMVGDDTDFGNVDVTVGTNANIFTIQNTGTASLNLTGTGPTYVAITGTNAADFTVTANPTTPVAASGNTTFTITFNPSAMGIRTATLTIANDDSDENPYNFRIQGTGTTTTQEINLVGNSQSIINNDTTPSVPDDTDFGNTSISGGTIVNTFTIENLGTVNNLNLTGTGPAYVAISGTNAADFTITANPTTPVAAINNTTFDITFNPSVIGLRSAIVTIANNDADENPYIFHIQGTGTNVIAPGGVTSNLELWLTGTEGLSYTDGQSVSLWSDQGNGADATVNTVGQEPTYKDNATDNINFNPVVDFDNSYNPVSLDGDFSFDDTSTQFLEGTSGYYSQDVFLVLIPDTTVNNSFGSMDVFCGDENPGTNETDATGFGLGAYTVRFSGEILCYAHGTTSSGSGYGVAEIGTGNTYDNAFIYNARNNSGATQQQLYYNAIDKETNQNDVPDFANVNDSRYWIGRSEGWEASTDARIAEIITYSSRKNDADLTQERNRIQSYLAIKYGITLGVNGTSQDYVDSNGTVIWDQSANSGYNYDIAGIGRDDDSGLNQKQSSSVNNDTDGSGSIEGIVTMGLTNIYDTNNINKATNPTAFNNQEFLTWGNNGIDLNLSAAVINVDMSAGIAGLSTPVTFTAMQRVWKVVEHNGDIPSVKITIPQNAVRNISPPGNYLMFVSSTNVFDPTADYRVMKLDGTGNLEADYDFDGTKFITFGYAPEVVVERSIYFDGVVDYVDVEDALDLNTAFTVSAWVKRGAGSTNTSILSKRDAAYTQGYDFKINSSNRFEMSWKNGATQTITSDVAIPQDEWHQVAVIYGGGTANLYIDGVLDKTAVLSAPVDTDESFYLAAAGKNSPTAFYEGNIDEVRVWDTALSLDQLRYVMNQEIEDNSNFVNGNIIPPTITKNDVASIPWTNLAGYYPMSVYTYTNTNDESGNTNVGALRNLDTVDFQTAPLPYESQADGTWTTDATWLNNSVQTLPNTLSIVDGVTPIDWNIVETNHNITIDTYAGLGRERSVLGLLVTSNELQVDGNTASGTGNGLTITHYLKLDGELDLEGESQLIQSSDSDLDVTSSGILERDQQGTADLFTYNYWAAPVGISNTSSNNNSYTLPDILFDGTTPIATPSAPPKPITFLTSGYNGTIGDPIGISDYWIWKFSNQLSDSYASWQHVRSTGSLNAGEGYTMKGVTDTGGAISTEQNYVYNGKPHNGDVTLTLSAGSDYLIGNPYASAIDADEFILDNVSDGAGRAASNIINGTLYFWEHFASSTHVLAEYQGGYGTYTLMGGVTAISNDVRINNTGASGTKTPQQYIPVGQGFFVTADTGGSVSFKNSQRIFKTEASDPSVFMRANNNAKTTKTARASQSNSDVRQKIRLQFDSPKGYYRQLLAGVDKTATDQYDVGFDALLIEDNKEDLFWVFDNEKYVIQAVDNFDFNQNLPLGIKIDQEGLGTIKIESLENIPTGTDIYLHDIDLDIFHNLKASDYEVFLTVGEHLERFEIAFNNNEALDDSDSELTYLDVHFSNAIKSIIIVNPTLKQINSVVITNVLGQFVYKLEDILNTNYSEHKVESLSAGTYIIELKTDEHTLTKKVIVE